MSPRPDPSAPTGVARGNVPGPDAFGEADVVEPDEVAEADLAQADVVEPDVAEADEVVEADVEEAEIVEPDVFGDGGTVLAEPLTLAAERDEYLGALQRLKADFENYRKRVLRQQEEQSARAATDLVTKLLPVLDTLDLAAAHLGAPSEGPTAEGDALAQARAMLVDVLAREGLVRVDQAEVPFDPVVHDAVAHAAADESEEDAAGGTLVDEVLRSGYRWRGQVLRPAMVRVRG